MNEHHIRHDGVPVIDARMLRLPDYHARQSLVYDLQEPFRWTADVSMVQVFESGVLDLPDFYFTGDDCRYRLETDAKRRFLELFRERFNAGVRYNGRVLKWDTVIEQKAIELGRYLVGRNGRLDFSKPSPNLRARDDKCLRRRILNLTHGEAQRLGIGKSTLHNLRNHAREDRPFALYHKRLGAPQ